MKILSPERIKQLEEMALAQGFTKAPPDHPIYSEGPQIIFLRPVSKKSRQSNSKRRLSD
jgi:hypothetical protein